MRLDKTTALAAVGLVAVVAAFLLGVLYLTPATQRPALMHSIGGPIAPALGIIATALAGIAARRATQAHTATQEQGSTLNQVKDQTNGALTARLDASSKATTEATVAAVAQLLDQRGVTTSQLVVPAVPAAPAPADFPPAPAPVVATQVAPPAPAPAYSVPAPLTVPATSVDPSVAAAAVPAPPVVPSVALAPQGS